MSEPSQAAAEAAFEIVGMGVVRPPTTPEIARVVDEAIDNFIRDELPGLLAPQLKTIYQGWCLGSTSEDFDSDSCFIASAIEQHRAEGREPA
jgi:hypothetical protein